MATYFQVKKPLSDSEGQWVQNLVFISDQGSDFMEMFALRESTKKRRVTTSSSKSIVSTRPTLGFFQQGSATEKGGAMIKNLAFGPIALDYRDFKPTVFGVFFKSGG